MLPAVTGDADAIDRIATTYGVYHEAQEGSAAEDVADDLSHFLS